MKPDNDMYSTEKLKELGNAAFRNKDWNQALSYYTKALQLCSSEAETQVCLKNRAAAYLQLEKYELVFADTSSVLENSPNDPKALYRRCQALERLNRFEEAYRDARHVLLVDPGNKEIQPVLTRLYQKVQEYAKMNSELGNKVTRMFELAFNPTIEETKRESAMNNILVLARERSGAKAIMEAKIVEKLNQTLKIERNSDIRITIFHVLNELCSNIQGAKLILTSLGIPWFIDHLTGKEENEVRACQTCIQTIIDVLSGKKKEVCDNNWCEENRKEIDTILTSLVYSCNSRTINGLARDAILQLITANVHFQPIDWASRLVQIKGVQRLMEVASEVTECRNETSMNTTEKTKTLVSACLARIYENMYCDQARQNFLENIDDYMKSKLITPDLESRIRVTVAINTLLTGPLEVGNYILGKDGIMEMILAMADSDDVVQQKVAAECIVASIIKQDKARFIVTKGIAILKKLYDSSDEGIRIRALVGLCKAASAGGTDASTKLFAEGSTRKMAEACKKFLIKGQDKETRRWAAEGFAFLSFDAEVKEMLIDEEIAIRALIDVAKSNVETSTTYAIVNIFVNLCNAYEKKEILPEMIELAKFAKRHIPEDHEFDDEDFVTKRVMTLGKLGITTALVALSSVDSDNCKELICRVFNALCNQPELRGPVVQQGGVKVLLKMASSGTENGKRQAAQALARIGVTMDPAVAFPGQRCMEVVRPLINLLHPECSALMNFEALLALCNLASISEEIREHIFAEKGVSRIESYMYEEHDHLRRAATQCITNLSMSPKLIQLYEGENDRLKFLYLLCGDDDDETSKAACGALALLTMVSKKCCEKIFTVKDWLEIFKQILAHPNEDVQLRAVVIAHNIIESGKENAQLLIESEVMEILMALSIVPEDRLANVRKRAGECLKKAEELNVIKKSEKNK